MLVGDYVFKRLLIFLILMFFALMLLYTDYLQELNFYQNKLQLDEFNVNFNTFKLLQESSLLNQQKLKLDTISKSNPINTKPIVNIKENVSNKDKEIENVEILTLNPPFPDIDLTTIGPVFIENGLIHLYCEYSFDCIRCTIGGKILPEKIYFKTTYFTNPNFENILINFGFKELIEFFKIKEKNSNNETDTKSLEWVGVQNLKLNVDNIELFTNYIMLFGANGTNMDVFLKQKIQNDDNNDNDDNKEISNENLVINQYKYYNFIRTQVCVLFVLIYLKLTNFTLFGITLIFQFLMHIPIYGFSMFKFEPNNKNIKDDEEEQQVDDDDDDDNNNKENIINWNNETSVSQSSSLRLRKGCIKEIKSSVSKEDNVSPLSNSNTMTVNSPISPIKDQDLETGNGNGPLQKTNSTLINKESGISIGMSTNASVTTSSNSSKIIMQTSLDESVDKYCLFYLLICLFFLFHLIVYEIINIILYSLISGVFEKIGKSNMEHFEIKNSSNKFKFPNISINSSNNDGKYTINRSILFEIILNIFGWLFNVSLAVIFHSVYTFCIYRYTVSVY